MVYYTCICYIHKAFWVRGSWCQCSTSSLLPFPVEGGLWSQKMPGVWHFNVQGIASGLSTTLAEPSHCIHTKGLGPGTKILPSVKEVKDQILSWQPPQAALTVQEEAKEGETGTLTAQRTSWGHQQQKRQHSRWPIVSQTGVRDVHPSLQAFRTLQHKPLSVGHYSTVWIY